MRWGWDTSVHNAAYVAYSRAGGTERSLLAKIALRPTAAWFGPWDPDASAGVMIRSYITAVTGGDPGVLAQLTVFRFDPWEGAACRAAPSSAAQSSYRRWVDSAAAGIGDSRVALILQPDLPFAQCSPGRRAWLGLAGYASQRFSALPHARYADAYVWVGRPWLDYGSNPFDLQRALGLARSSPF